jgi:hypothetical protein
MANARIVNTPSQAIAQDGTIHRQNTIGAAAENVLNWTLNSNTTHVLVQVGGADIRVTFDTVTDPTASIGFRNAFWQLSVLDTADDYKGAGHS